ncbi:ATP-dependent helicase HepA [Halalkalibacter krulwichiae]|uniref:ATP-dependent helicase HepA n=1 Tax=Halalkalibacter krulwichiae TaxID=199441 RepID=A0A1X9M991_9BACI|nr:ATP-dependent helicase HepA [Halalkalibacter krulwichiae]
MEIKINHKIIKEMCGNVSFKKGDSFYRSDKVTIHHWSSDFCEATVSGKEDFHVTIAKGEAGNIQTTCSCPTLANFQKCCQHVAAVLLALCDQQRQETLDSSVHDDRARYGDLTEDFLALFKDRPTRTSRQQRYFEKREILNTRLISKPVAVGKDQYLLGIELVIEETKVPHVREFLQDVKQGKSRVVSSKVTYDPSIHCFSNEADAVLQQLIRIIHDEEAYLETLPEADIPSTNETLLVPPSSWEYITSLLIKASFVSMMHDDHVYERFNLVKGSPPLQFSLKETDHAEYQLTIIGFERMIVLPFYSSVLCEGEIFQLEEADCERLLHLKQMLVSPSENSIPIPLNQIDFFLTKIVPGLKRIGEVQMSKALTETMLKTPLIAKLYLDRLRNRLLAGLEFQYGNVIIQPLESRDIPSGPMIIRDMEKEEEILQLMEASGFSQTDGGYFMQNELLEYEFLYHMVPKLKRLVQIYATTAIRNRIFRKHTPRIRVKVKEKERRNWLAFTFEFDGLAENEMKEVLAALEEKRKYYRLQNGSLLSLETREMEEIERFLNAVPVQTQEFEVGLNLPITEGLKYLDSIEESEVFKMEESFRQFLDQLQNPGAVEYEVPKELDSILRDYQKRGYQWLKTLASYGFGGVLADDMGLGKTVQSIAFILSELPRIRESGKPVLIVCPSSLTYNWLREIRTFASELQALVIDGKKEDREQLLKDMKELDVIITSYPLLRRDRKSYEKQSFHTVFFDEAQAFKNPVTQTARAVKRIEAEHRFGLTGTPVENSLEELWAIYHVVFPQLFQGLKEYSELTRKEIARRVRPFLLRRMKEDVLSELPEKEEILVSTDLLPDQKKLYLAYLAKLRHDTVKHLDKDTLRKNRIKILAGLTRLRQICCHPALFVDGYKGSSAKFEQLIEIVEESRQSGRRVLIFSQFTKMLELIGRELTASGHTYFYLDGQTPSEQRIELCNQFNEGERDLFLISLKAGEQG